MTMPTLRAGLPPVPRRMQSLPLDPRGYPVPWFVQWLDEQDQPSPAGVGRPEFRIMDAAKYRDAIKHDLCWCCGQRLGTYKAFLIGPMCAVNRVSSEPPNHLECAQFSAQACPFLSRPKAQRRWAGMPEGGEPGTIGGIAIKRNPGVALVWVCKSYRLERVDNGYLLRVGEPVNLEWYAEGRKATRAEIIASIESGLPILQEVAKQDGPAAETALARQVAIALELLPAA